MTRIVGLDIGYSGLKLVWGTGLGDKIEIRKDAVAVPVEQRDRSMDDGLPKDGVTVVVDGVTYSTCIPPSRCQVYTRDLHEDYPSQPTYKALYYAALSMVCADGESVNTLVTGLPTTQWDDKARRQGLTERLIGEHDLGGGKKVMVRNVRVVPQPAGALLAYALQEPKAVSDGQCVLVVDPGMFSVDWILVRDNALRSLSSGTSQHAMSVIVERAATLMRDRVGGRVNAEALEEALQRGRKEISIHGNPVVIQGYIDEAAKEATGHVIAEMRRKLRNETATPDIILMAGGGSSTFAPMLREAFPGPRVVELDNPVKANARGFFAGALQAVAKAKKQAA